MDPLVKVDNSTGEVSVDRESLIRPDQNYLNPLISYLGAEQPDSKTSQQLDYIYQQLKSDDKMTDGDLLTACKEIKFRVGYPRLGETMVSKIYNYLRASEGVKEAEKRRDALLT